LHYRRREHLVAKVSTDLSGCTQVYFPAKHIRQFRFHSGQTEIARSFVGLEFHKYVYIAGRAKTICQDGTEQREFVDIMPDTERRNLLLWKLDWQLSYQVRSSPSVCHPEGMVVNFPLIKHTNQEN
jgi:hypothetical protein